LIVLLSFLNIIICYQSSPAYCLSTAISDNVGDIKKQNQFRHSRRKCNIWVTGRIKIRDANTNQDVKAFITNTTQCYDRNGQSIDCKLLSPIWPVIMIREIKTTRNGRERPFAFMVKQIESPH
jgi:hypothetical protein